MRPRTIEANRRTPIVKALALYLEQATSKVPASEKDTIRWIRVSVGVHRGPPKKLNGRKMNSPSMTSSSLQSEMNSAIDSAWSKVAEWTVKLLAAEEKTAPRTMP